MRSIGFYGALIVIAGAGVFGCAPIPQGTGRIETFDVRTVLEPDGDLVVTEVIQVGAGTDGRVGLTRVIDSQFADAAIFGSFEVEGSAIVPGSELTVESTADDGLAITWMPAADRPSPTAVQITYVLERVAAVNDPRGHLEWAVLVAGHRHRVKGVRVTLDLPEGARFHEGTGVGQPGWTVEVTGGHYEATRASVPEGEAATLLAVFDLDRSQARRGHWEEQLDVRSQYVYALVSAGLFIGIIGLGVLIILRMQYPPVTHVPAERRAALADDRRTVSRGLRTTAVASLLLAATLGAAAVIWLSGLGVAVYAIPGSIAAVALLFLAASWWYGGEGEVR